MIVIVFGAAGRPVMTVEASRLARVGSGQEGGDADEAERCESQNQLVRSLHGYPFKIVLAWGPPSDRVIESGGAANTGNQAEGSR